MLHYGIANPPGVENGEISEFMDKFEIDQLVDKMQLQPVYINHHLADGDKYIEPAGVVTSSSKFDDGSLGVGFVLFNNESGTLAKVMLGEIGNLQPECRMKGLSLGYKIRKDSTTGIPYYHKVHELSICFEGAREGTKILGSIPIKDINKISSEDRYKEINNFYKNLKILQTT